MNLTQISDTLQKVIFPSIVEVVYQQKVILDFFKQMPKNGIQFFNNTVYITPMVGNISTYGLDNSSTFVPGVNTYNQMNVPVKKVTASTSVDLLTLESTATSKGALKTVMQQIAQGITAGLAQGAEIRAWGIGEGVLTLVNGATTGTSINVDSTFTLQPGMKLVIGTKTEIETGVADVCTITAVTSLTNITVTPSITVANNDRVSLFGIYSNGAYNDPMGIPGLVDYVGGNTTALQGITRTAQWWVNAPNYTTAGQLTGDNLLNMIQQADKQGHVDAIFANTTLYNRYGNTLTGIKRTMELKLTGSWTGLEVASAGRSIPFIYDFYAPQGDVYGLTAGEIGPAVMREFAPVNEYGNSIFLRAENQDIFNVLYVSFENNIVKNPQANFVMRNQTA